MEWLIDVYTNIPEDIGKNAWKKMGFEWFTNKIYFRSFFIRFICVTTVAVKQCPHAPIF
jgi:hypothetical protein